MAKSQPNVSVISLNFNGKKFLDKHYTSLLNQSYSNFETILVDNASTDGSVEFVKKNFSKVKIVKSKINEGPVLGYIKGVKSASDKSKYIVICGNDTHFDRDWLKKQVEVMEKDEKIGICGGRQMNYKGTAEINFGIPLDMFGYPTFGNKFFYIDGVAIMLRHKAYKDSGGFDERYWVYGEESDLVWRVRLLGYKVVRVSSSIFYHLGGATLDKKSNSSETQTTAHKRYLTERNTLCTLLKNYSSIMLFIIIPTFLIMNLVEGVIFTLIGRPSLLISHVRAWIWNVMNIQETIKKRRHIQNKRKVSDSEIIKNMYYGWGKARSVLKVGVPKIS